MKKVLIITYYWPPAGGGGVQRWLKLSKYFRQNGWKAIIHTAKPKEYVAHDDSLHKDVSTEVEVIKTPIWEPYSLYNKLLGKKTSSSSYSGFLESKKSGWKQRLSIFLRSNFFIPDARKFWIKPSVKSLTKYLEENPIEVIISTGPPHSCHLIALALKKKFKRIPWVADFRDPWTTIDYYKDLKLMDWADKKHRSLEKAVLQQADRVVVVTWNMAEELASLSGRDINTITNGYDPADFDGTTESRSDSQTKMLTYLGSLNKDRNPVNLWNSLAELRSQGQIPNLRVRIIGPLDYTVKNKINDLGLDDMISVEGFLPHDSAINALRSSDAALLLINQSANARAILPGKLYEYIASKKPILCIGPKEDSDIAKLFGKYKVGTLADYEDSDAIKSFLLQLHNGDMERTASDSALQDFSRANLAIDYCDLMNQLL